MTINKILIIIEIFLIPFSSIFAASGSGGQAGAFLRIPTGIRPAGMGYCFSAVADDPNAIYWNPGGLYQISSTSLSGTYSMMSLDRNFYNGCFVYPVRSIGTFSLSWNNFTISNIDGRDSQGNSTGIFDDSEIYLATGYSFPITDYFGIGGNVKYLSHKLYYNSANGLSFDFGVHSRVFFNNNSHSFRMGVCVSNFNAKLKWNTESRIQEVIPYTMRYGCAIDFMIAGLPILIAAESDKTKNEQSINSIGGEIQLTKFFALRSGYGQNQMNWGASLILDKFQLDYAFCPDIIEGSVNKIGFQINFSNPKYQNKHQSGKKNFYYLSTVEKITTRKGIVYGLINLGESDGINKGINCRVIRTINGQKISIGACKIIIVENSKSAFQFSPNPGYTLKIGDSVLIKSF